ncbi:MAG: sensor histidine kinase [Candidatus Limnocylindrales bacterium]
MARLSRLARLRPRPLLVDVLLAIALVALAVVASGVPIDLANIQRTWPTTPLILASILPLALRRVAPLISVIVVLTAVTSLEYVGIDPGAVFFSLIISLFSVGAYARSGRESVAGLAASFTWALLSWLRPENHGDLWIFLIFGILAGCWLVGDTLRRRTDQVAVFRARATALEVEREEASRRAVVEERARIARELHDVVAHSVSVMVVQAAAARRVLATKPHEARASLQAIETTGREALAEMRRLLGIMRREDLDGDGTAPQPGLARLATLVEAMRATGLPVELHIEGVAGALPPGVDVSAYRVVQEALTNALRHADPARVTVVVRYRQDDVEVEVSDDGKGSVADSALSGGGGLLGMRERVALFHGDFDAGTRAGGGFTVRARLPFGSSGG